jgi:hypothetical protein
METRLVQRKRLLLKLDDEYRAFLADLIRERATLAETERLRRERAGRRRSQKARKRHDQAA